MKVTSILVLALLALFAALQTGSAMKAGRFESLVASRGPGRQNKDFLAAGQRRQIAAAIIPGNSDAEYVLVSSIVNTLNIYNYLVTFRVLLSWFPQAQGVGALRPVFVLCDPLLNLFRGRIPPIGGFDISVIPAFLLLNFVTNAAPGLAAQVPTLFELEAADKKEEE
mmetsp:Transcript_35969/g.52642  ORF Transcript_35969/g.52642 Transcript_35969/m.52642 type:complete len:167 (+) Transcript_35969:30-530(+)|eukprot:CAMPEP_0194574620 /NCGR_PEP_ID=MMETSP0292-20121207/10400_1 /TAXON_ID=39354 /ORGANISM="Heterosigma akashiwo, Strain CCMP2393" /LENGTH=166 /DNA_ID=CAMNT_0039426181 /DNA_START=39 /DNA_END=539 /DNA_ORIENTATION=-